MMTTRAIAGLAAAALWATSAAASPEVACGISGYSNDPDPHGLNVRSGPDKGARIIAVLPHENDYAVEFEIVASKDGWLKIKDAMARTYSDAPDKKVFAGPGWIFADKARFEINDASLRASPRDDAPEVMPLHTADFSQGPDSALIDHAFGCDGGFADVEVHMDGGPHKRGWAGHICSNQVTTCP
jgi:hypothetical protein